MPKLDRELQRAILNQLAHAYPGLQPIKALTPEDQENFEANLFYLAQHGLVEVESQLMISGERSFGAPMITAKGMDFLADDGGLSAILGVVTVKLHDDTIRKLLIQKVEAAPGDTGVKARMVEKIKSLPAEALGKLTMDGLDKALSSAPNVIDLIGGLLG